MEDYILKDYETFEENPNGLLLLNKNSNLMFIELENSRYIARELIKSIVPKETLIKYDISYYSVKDNEHLLDLRIVRADKGYLIMQSNKKCRINIKPLCEVLKLKDNEKRYLDEEYVDILLNGVPHLKRKYK